jgi:hypothetical protein
MKGDLRIASNASSATKVRKKSISLAVQVVRKISPRTPGFCRMCNDSIHETSHVGAHDLRQAATVGKCRIKDAFEIRSPIIHHLTESRFGREACTEDFIKVVDCRD